MHCCIATLLLAALLLATGRRLLAVDYLAVGCWLPATSCLELIAGSAVYTAAVCSLQSTVHSPQSTVCWLLTADCWLLTAGYWVLVIEVCPLCGCCLMAAGSWLSAARCWLWVHWTDLVQALWIWSCCLWVCISFVYGTNYLVDTRALLLVEIKHKKTVF